MVGSRCWVGVLGDGDVLCVFAGCGSLCVAIVAFGLAGTEKVTDFCFVRGALFVALVQSMVDGVDVLMPAIAAMV